MKQQRQLSLTSENIDFKAQIVAFYINTIQSAAFRIMIRRDRAGWSESEVKRGGKICEECN